MGSQFVGIIATRPLGPLELGPPPLPMTAIVLGALSGRILLTFFRRTVEAASIVRIRLYPVIDLTQ